MSSPLPYWDPEVVYGELIEEMRDHLTSRPRDLQTKLGPSEVGEECDRALIAKLMGVPEPGDDDQPNWRAWVGTCIHDGQEEIFTESFMQTSAAAPRFLLETRVTVGVLGDYQLRGKCDLFDTLTGTVVDWKTKSATQFKKVQRHGMTQVYRVQGHCYGLGMANAGHPVRTVMLVFMLRDGEFADMFYLAEPFNPLIAIFALQRANRLYAVGKLLGAELAMAQFPQCTNEFCRFCGNYRAPYGAPKPVQTTVAGLLSAR